MRRDGVYASRTFVRDRRTWIATLVAGAVVWAGTSAWLNRRVELAARRAGEPNEGGRLVALAFDRVVRMPDAGHVDRAGLRKALRALATAGWQAVTLAEVRAAYSHGVPLPAKPFLLTFDEGYLSTFEAADPVLRELHWPAVMFLRTERQESRDVSFLFWDRLQRMVQSGLWEVASGDPPDAAPGPGPCVLPPEPPGARRIASRLGRPEVLAWAPRGEDPLTALGCVDAPREAFRWLGFEDDVAGAAPTDASPYRIPRLRVAPSWSPQELLARLDLAVASPPSRSPTGGPVPLEDRWVRGEGRVTPDGASLRLDGRPRAELWIPAARWVDDWELAARVVPGDGEFWVVQPDETRGREWRIGGADGILYVQVRERGQPPEVLARRPDAATKGRSHTLGLIKRGRGIRAIWDGTPVSNEPIALPARWSGKIELVAYSHAGAATFSVSDLRFSAYPYRVRSIPASPDASAIRILARDADSIAAISPPWATVEGGAVRERPIDRDLLRILSRKFAWDVVPSVAARGTAPGNPDQWASTLAGRAAEQRFDGLSLDLEGVASGAGDGWSRTAGALEKELRRSGKRLLVTR
jgi:polysaccharide deacetylase